MATCFSCEGTGWRRRKVPHPYCPGSLVTVTKVCPVCQGKGKVDVVSIPSGKDNATKESEETL